MAFDPALECRVQMEVIQVPLVLTVKRFVEFFVVSTVNSCPLDKRGCLLGIVLQLI